MRAERLEPPTKRNERPVEERDFRSLEDGGAKQPNAGFLRKRPQCGGGSAQGVARL